MIITLQLLKKNQVCETQMESRKMKQFIKSIIKHIENPNKQFYFQT